MKILNHRVEGAAFKAANATGGEIKPELIVAHDTAGALTKGNVVNYFASSSCSVSAHFVVERDGSFTQMVDLNRQANHAGRSAWKGVQNCNKRSIGIEIVNPGIMVRRGDDVLLIYRDNGKEKIVGRYKPEECVEAESTVHGKVWCLPYTDEQIETVKELCKAICAEYGIQDITTHWAISPGRKFDTTPIFPLKEVCAYALAEPEEGAPAVRPDTDDAANNAPIAATPAAKPSLNRTSRKIKTANAGETTVVGGGLGLAAIIAFVKEGAEFVKTYGVELAIFAGFLLCVYFAAIKYFTRQDYAEGAYTPSGERK